MSSSSPASLTSQFFSDKPVTKQECDDYAACEIRGAIEVVQPQGRFSYTVTADDDSVVVQFRERSSPLPETTDISRLIVQAHGKLVAPPRFVGALGGLLAGGLNVYVMDKLPGVNCSSKTELLSFNAEAIMAFVESLAKCVGWSLEASRTLADLWWQWGNSFFAQAWTRGRPDTLDSQAREQLATACRERLDALSSSQTSPLPSHLRSLVAQVLEQTDELYNGSYPITVTHGDLSEMNLLVDDKSGVLTGVVDWAEGSLLPFGFALYTLENALGAMCMEEGWVYHNCAKEARKHFWNTFNVIAQPTSRELQLMRVARLAGILFRYGTPVNSGFPGMLGLENPSGSSLQFMEVFVASEMD